jgi:hypothetical protein
MDFEFHFQIENNHRVLVSINPNVFNERREVRVQLIGQLRSRLDAQIPFKFKPIQFDIKKIKEQNREGYFCVIRTFEVDMSNQDIERQLLEMKFTEGIPLCHEDECGEELEVQKSV